MAQRCSMNTCSLLRISTPAFQPHRQRFEPPTADLRLLRAEAALLVAEIPAEEVAVVQLADEAHPRQTSCTTWT